MTHFFFGFLFDVFLKIQEINKLIYGRSKVAQGGSCLDIITLLSHNVMSLSFVAYLIGDIFYPLSFTIIAFITILEGTEGEMGGGVIHPFPTWPYKKIKKA